MRFSLSSRFVLGLLLGMVAFGTYVSLALAQEAAKPQWLWLSNQPKANERIFFRKSFELPADVKKANVAAACDNVLALFVNEKQVFEHRDWGTAAQADLTKLLTKGKNVLAVRAVNDGSGAAGLILRLDLELTDGKKMSIVTDGSWKVTDEQTAGWQKPGFDDSAWKAPHSFGPLGIAPWSALSLVPGDAPKVLATTEENINTLPGFKVELLYSVPKSSEGSWVNMTTDDQGRLIVSDQGGQGLYRVTPGKDADSTKVEKLKANISAAQGLLYLPENKTLYVVTNGGGPQGNGLYALRDTDGDDQFDEVNLLKKFNGGGEHGPHAVRRGPDGKLYVIGGNHTRIPEGCTADSPHKNYAEDLLLPRNPDGNGHATGVMAPGGWVAVTDLEGKEWKLFCAGFRNQYDIAFNTDGELFSYDADMEWDTGTPWYRPTRVNHAVSGAEFGWRYGTGKWPDYYVDSLGAVVDIGLGSPTGIEFGTGAKFPAKYQDALYICDWTYGKLYAVHMVPDGASYKGTFETFVSGRPLPLTDVVINPKDGALYFTIGGRGTQSGLYRVTYVGDESTAPASPAKNETAAAARKLRHELEAFHGKEDPKAIEFAWPHLNSRDRATRYAARVAVEWQPLDEWEDRALAETKSTAKIQALCALARSNKVELQGEVIRRLNDMPLEKLTEEQLLEALRVYQLAFIRLGGDKNARLVADVAERVSPLFPSQSKFINRELCQLLTYVNAPGTAARGMKLLGEAQTQDDQLFFAFVLRNVKDGWSDADRKAYFSWLNLAETKYAGGASFKKFIQQIRRDAVAKLSPEEQAKFKEEIEGRQTVEVVKLETTRQFKHNWQMEDLASMLEQVEKGRNFQRGKEAFAAAQCAKCHRFGGDGGSTGPDITGVGARFSPEYLLEAMILPSKVVSDQYKTSVIMTEDGEVITGRIIEETDDVLRIRTDPFAASMTEVAKAKIEDQQHSQLSEMPQGLINVLSKEEILDLIAYLRSAGSAEDKAFKP